MWENTALGIEFLRIFYAGIVLLQLGVVLFVKVSNISELHISLSFLSITICLLATAVSRERDELLALLDVTERLKYEQGKSEEHADEDYETFTSCQVTYQLDDSSDSFLLFKEMWLTFCFHHFVYLQLVKSLFFKIFFREKIYEITRIKTNDEPTLYLLLQLYTGVLNRISKCILSCIRLAK